MLTTSSLYAAIDLGSNSFHMLIVREVAGSIQIVTKVKRKVRLAAGLDKDNNLSDEAMQRGWQCLKIFAERLQDIPRTQIRVVATATLRLAANADVFISTAQTLIDCPIQIISGQEEARLIYQGVAHTTGGADERLVVDIGGASTELVIGKGAQPSLLLSLPMGCVTWLERYFSDRVMTQENFERAQQAAINEIQPVLEQIRKYTWQICVGASGTVQALQEIMVAQGMDERITLAKLLDLKQQAIACGKLEELDIEGLTLDRALVFPSGLAILIAIFEQLHVHSMNLAGGALREGLVYGMLNVPIEDNIRQRTIQNLQMRYFIDTDQAQRVDFLAQCFFNQVASIWSLDEYAQEWLHWASLIHEIGLNIDFKLAPQHAAYLIHHIDLPGFTPAQKKLLSVLVLNQTNPLDPSAIGQQNAISHQTTEYLIRLLRLAIIFASRRRNDTLPEINLTADKQNNLTLSLPKVWLKQHPLCHDALLQEIRWQNNSRWSLRLEETE